MGVKERAVVAQRIPTVSLFLEDFQTSHFQATEAKVRMEEGRREQQARRRWRNRETERETWGDGRGYSFGMLQWF